MLQGSSGSGTDFRCELGFAKGLRPGSLPVPSRMPATASRGLFAYNKLCIQHSGPIQPFRSPWFQIVSTATHAHTKSSASLIEGTPSTVDAIGFLLATREELAASLRVAVTFGCQGSFDT